MTDIHMADISEFQENIDAPTYLRSGCQVVICRTHNGHRPDHMMPVRRDYLRRHPFVAVGFYAYLVADRDAATQAHEFLAGLGGLRGNEWLILDLEEGAGDQKARAEAWFAVVDKFCGFPAMLYSGESFLRHQLGGSAHWKGRPIWIAAYPDSHRDDRASEPPDAHSLWQFSDRFRFAGITGATDASVHHGTASEFLASVRAGHAPQPTPPRPPAPPRQDVLKPDPPKPVPAPKPPETADMTTLETYFTADQRVGFAVVTEAGEVKHIEQQHAPGSKDAQGKAQTADFWRDKDGKANWLSLGKP